MAAAELPLTDAARAALQSAWKTVQKETQPSSPANIPDGIRQAISRSINSATKTYRYVLLTQLSAKSANPSLDCRSIQADCGLQGAFDARSICDHVVVPFDRDNHNVLGGSTEPYVNNPLRIPATLEPQRQAQRDKKGFDDLRLVLDHAQQNPGQTMPLLRLALAEVRSHLAAVHIVYPVPNRIGLRHVQQLLSAFLEKRTGGIRLQAVAVALFQTIGDRFKLFDQVRSQNINAADANTGSAADLECVGTAGKVVMAVEVKDRRLTLRHLQDKLPAVRERGIAELLFIVQNGIEKRDADAVQRLSTQQFATGQNIYVCEFSDFLNTCIVLFAETGRRQFFQRIGEELDRRKAELSHRQHWRDLLESI